VAANGSRTSAPEFPPGRYGRRRDPVRQRRRRLIAGLLAVVVGAAGVAIAIKLYNQYVAAPYRVSSVTTTAVTDTSVTVTFEVTLPAGSGASCTVIAETRTGEQVGGAEIPVPPAPDGQNATHVTYKLTTSERAFAGTVPGCGPPR
jgi:hypothetical protein